MKFIIAISIQFLLLSHCNAQQNINDTIQFGEIIYTKVDVEATFKGGGVAWRNYLLKNFKITKVTKKMPQRDSVYRETGIVRFVVKKDGRLADVRLENEVPSVLKDEVLRLIAESPNWEPAILNGKKVNTYLRLPISILIPAK